MTAVAEGLEWKHIYWVSGPTKRGFSRFRHGTTDPPTSGWSHGFVLTGPKRSTVFCPYSLSSHQLPNDCMEMATAVDPPEWRRDVMVRIITANWASAQKLKMACDLDTAAVVLSKLGAEVPTKIMTAQGEDTKARGGKDTGERLLKPVKRAGKRGKFLEWWMEGGNVRSVREAMAQFGMTRSNVLSYLFILQKDHGIGYTLVGDAATIALPSGVESPFDDAAKGPAKAGPKAEEEDWLK